MWEDYVITSQLLRRTKNIALVSDSLYHYTKNNAESIMSSNNEQVRMYQKALNIIYVYKNVLPTLQFNTDLINLKLTYVLGWMIWRKKLKGLMDVDTFYFVKEIVHRNFCKFGSEVPLYRQILLLIYFL